jgi:hypothetical protein
LTLPFYEHLDLLHNTKWHGRTLEVREDRGYVEQPSQKKGALTKSSLRTEQQKEVVAKMTDGYEVNWTQDTLH